MKQFLITIIISILIVGCPRPEGTNNLLSECTPRSEVKGFVFGHSLFTHHFVANPEDRHYTTTGFWLGLLAQASGTHSSHGGSFGQFDTFNADWIARGGPPTGAQYDYPTNTQEFWAEGTGNFSEQGFTDFYFMAPNFIQSVENPSDRLTQALELLDNITNIYPNARYHFYVHWAEPHTAASALGTSFTNNENLTPSEFALYNSYNSSGYWDWHTELFQDIREARPEIDIRILPLGPVISDLLENEPYLSTVTFLDLYEDDAPHGRADKYFLAALVTYRSVYCSAPMTSNLTVPAGTPEILEEIFSNLNSIVAYIDQRLDHYIDPQGQPR